MSKDMMMAKLVDAVKEGQAEQGEELAKGLIKAGVDPLETLNEVTAVLKEIGEAFSRGELFIVHMVMASEAAKAAMAVLTVEIKKQRKEVKYAGRFLIGTVAGDIHDIGKRLVATLCEVEGYEVIDLGIDVPTQTIVEKVKEFRPDVLGLSALVTSTMPVQGEVIEALEKVGLRNKVKVIVGGSAVSASWAEEVGADSFASDAKEALSSIKELMKKTK